MDKLRKMLKTIAGALGWGMMGGMILVSGIGPEWLGWTSVIAAGCAIACAMDKALTPERGHRYG